jgi:hypothetical protein
VVPLAVRGSSVAPLVVLLGAFGTGCRSKGDAGRAVASARASAAASASVSPPSGRCRELPSEPLRIGEAKARRARPPAEDEHEEDDATLPFAPHLGEAVAVGGYFAVAGQRPGGGGTEDVLAVVADDGRSGRVLSLGRVYGDVDPPVLAARGAEVLLAVPDSDAKGGTLKLSILGVTADAPRALGEVTDVEHAAGSAVALGAGGALVVWGTGHGEKRVLRAAWVATAEKQEALQSFELEGTLGAELPALALRPDGFWLSWVAEKDAPDAGPPGEDQALVVQGPRVLAVMPLDRAGKPSGRPRPVSGEAAHVVGFDAVSQADGALDLAWREDDASPGADRGDLQTARVALDGSLKTGRAEADDLAGGVPSLFFDATGGGRTWVALRSTRDTARLGVLAGAGLAVEGLAVDPGLGSGDVLAAAAGRLLVGRYRGGALELVVVSCRP